MLQTHSHYLLGAVLTSLKYVITSIWCTAKEMIKVTTIILLSCWMENKNYTIKFNKNEILKTENSTFVEIT